MKSRSSPAGEIPTVNKKNLNIFIEIFYIPVFRTGTLLRTRPGCVF